MTFMVLSPGLQSLIQDAGRPGLGSSGVTASGAFDRSALRQANALVGNPPDAACLEVLAGGLRLCATREHTVAVTGAVGDIRVAGHPVEHGRPFVVFPDQEVALGLFDIGMRAYMAAGGGFEVGSVLDSQSSDTLSDLGPDPLDAGDELGVGAAGHSAETSDVPALITSGSTAVDVLLGPRDDWFSTDAISRFFATSWIVSAMSNRVGIRLDGPELDRANAGELPSEPCVFGSIQVTSAGQPVVLGPDHPVTGGYPVIAVVADRHLDRLAQLRPGETLRFRRA